MFTEHDRVVLTRDIEASELRTGVIGTIVHIYPERAAFEVEFLAPDRRNAVVATLLPSQIRPAGPGDLPKAGARPAAGHYP